MNKYLIILFLLFSGCVTQQRCLDKFPPTSNTIIEYRDTIIPVYIHSTDTVERWGTIRDTLIVHSGSAHGKTWVIHDTLRLEVWQTDSTYIVRLDSALQVIRQKDVYIKEVKKENWLTEVKHILLIVLGLFMTFLILKIIRR